MSSRLTIAYCTSRKEPKIRWFFDSLARQVERFQPQIIVVDLFNQEPMDRGELMYDGLTSCWDGMMTLADPKPTVWQGHQRLTKEDWWAVSNSRNTALCLARGDYIVWVDDRCLLSPTWLQATTEAMLGNYAVCGTYEKRHGMKVENGVMTDGGILNSEDGRKAQARGQICRAPGQWFFGGTLGCPVEWALQVNGFDECMDSLSAEDCLFGMHLENNGFKIMHDPNLKIIEDRTPGECGPDMKRSSKEKHPKDVTDKGHEAFRRFGRLKRASHHWDLRAIRESVLAGNQFPGVESCPKTDWFDGMEIKLMS